MEQAQAIQAVPTYSSLAIFGLAFGVLAWTALPVAGMLMASMWLYNFIALPLTGSFIALICGLTAQRQIRRANGALLGAGLAKAARLLAYTQYALLALIATFAVVQTVLLNHQTTFR